ncbi:MAG: hypothetical protein JF616_05990 [Fibrobacteres bacterium]|nr:hypothetical protein [Fibrobacterota bacterium]
MPDRSDSEPFRLDSAALERLFRAYRLPMPTSGLVLFALRGALPETPASGWVRSLRVHRARVDYVHMRCTLGIWDRAGGRIFAAPGSTVPHKDNVRKAAARKGNMRGRGTNQLEPGYYVDLTKGEHLQGKLNGHQALRQTASRLYRRSPRGLPYSATSPLYYGNPYDNLHCGWNLDGLGPGFSSAGCMVVAGLPLCPRRSDAPSNRGPWQTFHKLLYAVPQTAFPILLAPADEALKLMLGPGRTALTYGSEGEDVMALQGKLKKEGRYQGRVTGRLDARTYRAWKRPRSGRAPKRPVRTSSGTGS